MAPALQGVTVDGAAHLFVAGCIDHPSVGVKVQAGLIPVQATEGHQLATHALHVLHQVLVAHRQLGQVQHLPPVFHEAFVGTVIPPQAAQVAGIGMAAVEAVEIDGQAGVQWFAYTVDDTRLREQQLDQAQVQEVVWQFVGNALCARRHGLELLQVAAGHLRHLLWAAVPDAAGVGLVCTADFRQRLGQFPQGGQLATAMHLWMGGEDLFHQAGAAARQADDEYRLLGIVVGAGQLRHGLGAEDGAQLRYFLQVTFQVVGQGPQFLGALVMVEGRFVTAGLFIQPGQGEQQWLFQVGFHLAVRLQLLQQRQGFRPPVDPPAQGRIGEGHLGAGLAALQQGFQAPGGLLIMTLQGQHIGQFGRGHGMAGLQGEGGLQPSTGRIGIAQAVQYHAQADVRPWQSWLQFDCL